MVSYFKSKEINILSECVNNIKIRSVLCNRRSYCFGGYSMNHKLKVKSFKLL